MLQSNSSEKQLVKTLTKLLFWVLYEPQPKTKNIFFSLEITKADRQLSKIFYFIKILLDLAKL